MSGEIVSLGKARKARAKAETSAKSAANRVIFGRTKAERTVAKAQSDKAAAILDGHKRTPPRED
jgi:hypothetical protein